MSPRFLNLILRHVLSLYVAVSHPKNSCKTAREEDSLHCSEGDEALTERGLLACDPPECPLSLAFDPLELKDGIEEQASLLLVPNVRLDL